MNRHEETQPPDDFELSDLEHDAFLPNERATSRKLNRKPSIFTRWMPVKARKFVENLSRIKVRSDTTCFWLFADKSRVSRS